MRALMLACLAALAASAARAEDDPNHDDVRCVLAMAAMQKNPQFKDAGAAGLFYFAGRIEGRDPGFDLDGAMKREMSRMQAADFALEAKRCGGLLAEKNRSFKSFSDGRRSRGRGVGG